MACGIREGGTAVVVERWRIIVERVKRRDDVAMVLDFQQNGIRIRCARQARGDGWAARDFCSRSRG